MASQGKDIKAQLLRPPSFRLSQPAQHRAQWADVARNSVRVGDHLAGVRRDARAGGENADEVQRIGGGDDDGLVVFFSAARGAEKLDRLGQRELLAGEAVDEPAAANFSARFEPVRGLGVRLTPALSCLSNLTWSSPVFTRESFCILVKNSFQYAKDPGQLLVFDLHNQTFKFLTQELELFPFMLDLEDFIYAHL